MDFVRNSQNDQSSKQKINDQCFPAQIKKTTQIDEVLKEF